MYIIFNVYYIIFKKPIWKNIKAPKPNTEKLAKSQSSSCLFHHSAACSCIYILTPSPITDRLLFSLKKQNLPQILHIFSPRLPARCGTFCYLLHESLAVRAGLISEVVNVVLHIPIVTECFNHTRIFTTPLSPSSVTLLGPNPFGRLLPSTVSRPSHPIPHVILVSATPREQRFHPSHNSSKKKF